MTTPPRIGPSVATPTDAQTHSPAPQRRPSGEARSAPGADVALTTLASIGQSRASGSRPSLSVRSGSPTPSSRSDARQAPPDAPTTGTTPRAPLPPPPARLSPASRTTQAAEASNAAAVSTVAPPSYQAATVQRASAVAPSSALSKAHAAVSEILAKATASGFHFGVVRNFTEAAVLARLGDEFIEHHPQLASLIAAGTAAEALAAAHYIGETVLRPLLLSVLGAKVAPTKLDSEHPDDGAARSSLANKQAAGLIGKLPADLMGLIAFGVAQGVRGAAGLNSPGASAVASFVGGGGMTLLHLLHNLNTSVTLHDGSQQPTHTVKRLGIKDTGKEIAAVANKSAEKGNPHHKLLNTLHEIFVTRGLAAAQGLLVADQMRAAITRHNTGHEPNNGETFGQGFALTVGLLGLAFFANLKLADRRAQAHGSFAGTRGEIDSMLNFKAAATNGGASALYGMQGDSKLAKGTNAALQFGDQAYTFVSGLLRLPSHLLLDSAVATVDLAKSAFGSQANATSAPAHAPDLESALPASTARPAPQAS